MKEQYYVNIILDFRKGKTMITWTCKNWKKDGKPLKYKENMVVENSVENVNNSLQKDIIRVVMSLFLFVKFREKTKVFEKARGVLTNFREKVWRKGQMRIDFPRRDRCQDDKPHKPEMKENLQ